METLHTPLMRLFNEASQKVLDAKWTDFSLYKTSYEILPCPDLPDSKSVIRLNKWGRKYYCNTEREDELIWQNWATVFVSNKKERVNHNLHQIERHLIDELAPWNRDHSEKNVYLPPDRMHQVWLTSVKDLSLAEFCNLSIGSATVRQFLTPKFDELRERYRMYDQKTTRAPQKQPTPVFINNNARAKLIAALTPFVDETAWGNLRNLINGKPAQTPITTNCQQNALGRIFYQSYVDKCTQAPKRAFAKWICRHFERQTDGQVYPLTESTMMNHLKGMGFNED